VARRRKSLIQNQGEHRIALIRHSLQLIRRRLESQPSEE
jgi:hypothetical protein